MAAFCFRELIGIFILATLCLCQWFFPVESVVQSIPFRINFGGASVTDSKGRIWEDDANALGDTPDIRVDDGGGKQVIVPWTPTPLAASLVSAGFSDVASDRALFQSMRWDQTSLDGITWNNQMTIPDGDYLVKIYTTEVRKVLG